MWIGACVEIKILRRVLNRRVDRHAMVAAGSVTVAAGAVTGSVSIAAGAGPVDAAGSADITNNRASKARSLG